LQSLKGLQILCIFISLITKDSL